MTEETLLTIESQKINQAVPETSETGGTLNIMLSVFDVPERAFSVVDKDSSRVGFRFEYLGGAEPTFEQVTDEKVILVLGKSSKRLFGLYFPLDLIAELDAKGRDLHLAFDLAEREVNSFRRANPKIRSRSLEAVNRVFDTYHSQLAPIMKQAVGAF